MKQAKGPARGMKFEKALEELQKIVDAMEEGHLPLDSLIERYEQGMKLVEVCEDKLSDATRKVEILTRERAAAAKTKAAAKTDAQAGDSDPDTGIGEPAGDAPEDEPPGKESSEVSLF